jgi:hypothetical protein
MVRYVFLGFALLSLGFLILQLWTGKVYIRKKFVGTRQTAPSDFWLSAAIGVAFFIIGLATFLYMTFHSIN